MILFARARRTYRGGIGALLGGEGVIASPFANSAGIESVRHSLLCRRWQPGSDYGRPAPPIRVPTDISPQCDVDKVSRSRRARHAAHGGRGDHRGLLLSCSKVRGGARSRRQGQAGRGAADEVRALTSARNCVLLRDGQGVMRPTIRSPSRRRARGRGKTADVVFDGRSRFNGSSFGQPPRMRRTSRYPVDIATRQLRP